MISLILSIDNKIIPNKKSEVKTNILFISIDTWNFKHAGFHDYRRNITPALDRLASNGIVFNETTTPIPITDPSHASMFTGLYPRVHGLMDNGVKMFNLEFIYGIHQRTTSGIFIGIIPIV